MSEFLRCRDCKHDKGKCVGSSRRGGHKNCFEPREMTNADRIRGMSDEELAALIMADPPCDEWYGELCNIHRPNCKDCVLDWLQQPAEEGTR